MAEKLFGDWAKPKTALAQWKAAPAVTTEAAGRVVVIDKPDAGQAAVFAIRRGLQRTDADFVKALVANAVLGGGYSARLNQEIRIKRGLSYGARSGLDVRRDVGSFLATTQTKNESAAEVAGLLTGEIGRLASEPIADVEFVPRKATLTGNFARNLETTDGIVDQIAVFALYGLDLDEANRYIANVEAVTPADVQKLSGARLGAKGVNVVVVGNAKAFVDDLRKQFPNVEVISVDQLDLNSAALKAAAAATP